MRRSGEDARDRVSCSARERSVEERRPNPDSEKRRAESQSGNHCFKEPEDSFLEQGENAEIQIMLHVHIPISTNKCSIQAIGLS